MRSLHLLQTRVIHHPDPRPPPHDMTVFRIIRIQVRQQYRVVAAVQTASFQRSVQNGPLPVRLQESPAHSSMKNLIAGETQRGAADILRQQQERRLPAFHRRTVVHGDHRFQRTVRLRRRKRRQNREIPARPCRKSVGLHQNLPVRTGDCKTETARRRRQKAMPRRKHQFPLKIRRPAPVDVRSLRFVPIQLPQKIQRIRLQRTRHVTDILIHQNLGGIFGRKNSQRHRGGLLFPDASGKEFLFLLQGGKFFKPYGTVGETACLTGRKGKCAFMPRKTAGFKGAPGHKIRQLLRVQRRIGGVPLQGGPLPAVQIHRNKKMGGRIRGGTGKQHRVLSSGIKEHQRRPVMKRRMHGKKNVQTGNEINLVHIRSPVQGARLMHINPFLREPFHSVGKSEGTVYGSKRGERRAHLRVFRGDGRQTVVVMRFGIMNQKPVRRAQAPGVTQIAFDLDAGIVLEEFGISPVHIRGIQQPCSDGGVAAKPFQKENRLRIFLPHPGNDVGPCGRRNHIAGIAAETVHSARTPDTEHLRQIFPELGFLMIQFRQIPPDHSPGPGGMNGSIRIADKPVGMFLMQSGGPARVIDRYVNEKLRILPVDGIHQFEKLIQRRCLAVEFGKRGIHFGEVQRGIGTAVTPHSPVHRRRRRDRKQMNDPALQTVDYVIQLPDQIPERAGRRNHRIPVRVQRGNPLPRDSFRKTRMQFVAIHPELPHKGAVHRIGTTVGSGGYIDVQIVPGNPLRFGIHVPHKAAFAFKMPFLGQGKTDQKGPFVDSPHGDVPPVLSAGGDPFFRTGNDFTALNGRIPDVGAEKRPPLKRRIGAEMNFQNISAIKKSVFPRRGVLYQFRHGFIPWFSVTSQ